MATGGPWTLHPFSSRHRSLAKTWLFGFRPLDAILCAKVELFGHPYFAFVKVEGNEGGCMAHSLSKISLDARMRGGEDGCMPSHVCSCS